ncbi:MAG: flavodoxin family protein [Clostridia bacterium]|nr:flavodoxin family protein [Clostridia bacterium]MBR2449228.1 flavodoxin family protein [Clostridia bacterium]
MKVLLINGSPHENGTTFRALSEVAAELNSNDIDTEIVTVGDKPIVGCTVCGGCSKLGKCVKDDLANEIIAKIDAADGLIVGSPVYYASLNGSLKALLDRVFFAKKSFAYKPAAAVAVARRAGTTATIDIINKYFTLSNMPVVSSQYWNMVFGSNGKQADDDAEGLQTMRVLGKNMAWLIKCIKAGKEAGVNPPEEEKHVRTNFYKG